VVDSLSNLRSLTELNLRRNQIVKVTELHCLPVLQRVFLSNNLLKSFDDAESLFGIKYLVELALDGNPLAMDNPQSYRR
jgi:Leucine-rich repeat (LRR) protein